MREIDRVRKTFNSYPDHVEVPTSRKDIKMAACPDCDCEVFSLRVITYKNRINHPEGVALTRFYANCIYCNHQLILGEYDWDKEEHQ